MELISHLEFWHWLVLGLVFIIIEMLAPAAIFLWFGVAAAIVGVIMFVFPSMSWELQLILFSVLSVTSIVAWKAYAKSHPPEDNQYPTLNKRGEDLIGRVFTLEEDIVNNYGKIRVDDTMWKIRGDDVVAGNRVRVTQVDGTVLVVEPDA